MNATTSTNIENPSTSSNLNITGEISFPSNHTTSLSSIITLTSTSTTTLGKNLLYGDNCSIHEECTLSKRLYCEYEFDFIQKHCFCETTYFWNQNTQQCGQIFLFNFSSNYTTFFLLEPKKDVNEGQ